MQPSTVLTRPQRLALAQACRGGIFRATSFPDLWAPPGSPTRMPDIRVFSALWKRGWIEPGPDYGVYVATEAGRAALAEHIAAKKRERRAKIRSGGRSAA